MEEAQIDALIEQENEEKELLLEQEKKVEEELKAL